MGYDSAGNCFANTGDEADKHIETIRKVVKAYINSAGGS